MRKLFIAAVVMTLISLPVSANTYATGEELVEAMHKKYSGKWYRTLTFVQKNTIHRPDGTTANSVWYEAMSLPGRLHIDFGSTTSGNGMLFVDGKQFIFQKGREPRSRAQIHPLMVLGFDVYGQPPATTLKQLDALKFDLSVVREDKWQGRDVYVVGAKQGDLKTSQFWIDKERLLMVRILRPGGQGGTSVSETQFNKYEKVPGGGWIAPEVVFLTDGKKTFVEEYSQMRFNIELDDNLFDPEMWGKADTNYYLDK